MERVGRAGFEFGYEVEARFERHVTRLAGQQLFLATQSVVELRSAQARRRGPRFPSRAPDAGCHASWTASFSLAGTFSEIDTPRCRSRALTLGLLLRW